MHLQRIVGQQPPDQWRADADDELDGFRGSQRPEHPGKYPEHPDIGAVGHHALGGIWKQAAIAGTAIRDIGRDLSFKAMNRG